MHIEEDVKLDFADVLIRPKRSTLKSRKDVDLERTFAFKDVQTWTGVPIIAANMDGVGSFEMAKELAKYKMMTALTKHKQPSDYIMFYQANPSLGNYAIYSLGTGNDDLEKFKMVEADTGLIIKHVCIDVANGYGEYFVNFCARFKEMYPRIVLFAGNVATPEMVEQLAINGVNAIKVGIGPGSVCTTRRQTGIGYPQLSAVIECADAAHGLGAQIVADGGCTVPGDIAKAFGGGADFVMLGGMLAGHKEGGGTIVGDKVQFYGMSSDTAQEQHGGVKEYRASEGRTVSIPYKGLVGGTVQEILGGLRSTLTYVGAAKLKELHRRTTFVRVSRQLNTVFER